MDRSIPIYSALRTKHIGEPNHSAIARIDFFRRGLA